MLVWGLEGLRIWGLGRLGISGFGVEGSGSTVHGRATLGWEMLNSELGEAVWF